MLPTGNLRTVSISSFKTTHESFTPAKETGPFSIAVEVKPSDWLYVYLDEIFVSVAHTNKKNKKKVRMAVVEKPRSCRTIVRFKEAVLITGWRLLGITALFSSQKPLAFFI